MIKKAVITNNIVENIIVCNDNGISGMSFPLGTILWDCGQYDVQIGDTFEDGVFSRNGEELEPQPTDADRIDELIDVINALLGGEENE